jgi:hypothetical protein
MGDSQLKVHLSRLVDLEYVVVHRAGPATSYELVPAAAAADRPGADGDRPGAHADRPGADGDRPGIGRVAHRGDRGPSAQVGAADGAEGADRPGPGALRVVGTDAAGTDDVGTGGPAGTDGGAPVAQVAP